MKTQSVKVVAAVAFAIAAAGCTSTAAENTRSASMGGDTSDLVSAADYEAAQRRVSQLESELAEREREIASMPRAEKAGGKDSVTDASGALFPPNPTPGECYARVLIPAQYKTSTEEVLVREASERYEIVPASYRTVDETVLVREASTRLEVVPAVYEEVQERVMVKPASSRLVEVPAEYKTVTERVLDKPAHTVWKRGPATLQAANVLEQSVTDTGEIMCLVEVPATYRTIEKRVLVSPARTEEVEIPAEYKMVTRRVVSQPATTREVTIPAEYDTVSVTQLVSAPERRSIAIPAEYQTVSLREKVTDERMEWRSVVCEVNMTQANVRALQRALQDKGYYKAGLDGIIGSQTLTAARSYALANNLPAGTNYVPLEVVESLNLNF